MRRAAAVLVVSLAIQAAPGRAAAQGRPSPEHIARVERVRDAVLSLLGAQPATLAPALAGVRLGMPEAEARAALAPLEDYARAAEADVTLDVTEGVLRSVFLHFPRDRFIRIPNCIRVYADLEARWGPPNVPRVLLRRSWLAPDTKLRVTIGGPDGCDLRLDAAAAAPSWIDVRARTAVVPLWLIGRPAAELERVGALRARTGGSIVTWRAPGLAGGEGDTEVTVRLARGRIRSVRATTLVSAGGYHALVEHLTSRLGKPHDTDHGLRFPGRLAVRVYASSAGQLTVTAGDPR